MRAHGMARKSLKKAGSKREKNKEIVERNN
jgi:hypothetical protein